jgi:RNA polymerase sigma factor (TIGR02999 family)
LRPAIGPLPLKLLVLNGRSGLYLTLRRGGARNVMPLENISGTGASGLEASAAVRTETPEQRRALDDLFSVTYEELRRLAFSVGRYDPSATFTPTVLVNEAWLKLARSPEISSVSQLHFKRIAARAMRQILVEAARRRHAQKRGGEEAVPLIVDDESMLAANATGTDVLALDSALQDLARIEPRQAAMVELRFFGGSDVGEAAALLGISEATVLRDWRAARAWLAQELRRPK